MVNKHLKSSILSKSVLILETLGHADGAMRFTDLVAATNFSKGTTHRILGLLVGEGLIHFDAHTKNYRLGMKIMEWAARVWRDFDLREAALEEMRTLNAETGENVNLAIRENNEIIYMNRVESFKPVRAVAALGSRASVHCTGLGKALTAFLPIETQYEIAQSMTYTPMTEHTLLDAQSFLDKLVDVRKNGYAMDECEFRDEIRCIAAPIFDYQGSPVGGISVTSLVYRVPRDTLLNWVPLLLKAATAVSRKIGYVPPLSP